MTIRKKIFSNLFVVIALFVVAVNIIVYSLLRDLIHEELAQGLNRAADSYHRYREQSEALLLTRAGAMAQAPSLKSALADSAADPTVLNDAGTGLKAIATTDLMLLVGPDAKLLADFNRPQLSASSVRSYPGIDSALNGKPFTGLWHWAERLHQVAVAPVMYGEGVGGLVVAGNRMSNPATLAVLEEISGHHVALLTQAEIHTSNAPIFSSEVARLELRAAIELHSGELDAFDLNNDKYYFKTLRLNDGGDQLVFLRQLNDISARINAIHLSILIASIAALLCALVASYVSAKRIGGPITALTRALQQYGQEDASAPPANLLQVADGANTKRSSREVEQLAAAFKQMAKRLDKAFRELSQSRDKAVAAEKTKSEFLAMMSHEIRTPMNGIMGMADLLTASELAAEDRDYVNTIRISCASLIAVINDILDYSQLEAGKIKLESIHFSLRELIAEVIDIQINNAREKNIVLEKYVEPAVPDRLTGDPIRLRQVILNLVSNAVKFTDRGYVFIHVLCESRTDASVSLVIDVKDSGLGIPAHKLATIFDAFSQADTSTTRLYGGSGLGLTICRNILRCMGGAISVDSVYELGSTFTARAPFPYQATRDENDGALANKTALVQTLEVAGLCPLQALLRGWGVAVQPCAHAGEMFDCLAREAAVDFVFARYTDADREILSALMAATRKRGITLILLYPRFARSPLDQFPTRDKTVLALETPYREAELRGKLLGRAAGGLRLALPPTGALSKPLKNPAILLVEDNPVNQQVAAAMLTKLGCRVTVKADGAQATQGFKAQDYDLVLLDCQMPVMDGYQAARVMRELAAGHPLPIIALTANVFASDIQRCLDSGMDEVLHKPVSLALLAKTLEHYLKDFETPLNMGAAN